MRAARLLQILLILQNRGRQTSVQMAEELEVSPRTILRDVDAMTEAGLPIIVHQGNQGGIELGFDYRTRLTGLARDEAQALGLILSASNPMIGALGLEQAATRARAKLVESFPDRTREHVSTMMKQFRWTADHSGHDARISAMARAVQAQSKVRVQFATDHERLIHPIALALGGDTWRVQDALQEDWLDLQDWGRINISARTFG
ncbi:MAG: helix-turn-helix transcriptional regulator [Paracoccaceae bacterium]